MTDKAKRTVRSFYLFSSFSDLLIIGPIIVLFMLGKGLSFTEIMLLQSVCALAVFLFEVPTGALADKVSRKVSLCLGAVFYALGLFIYIVGNSFIAFAIGEIVFSLGTAMKSGANTALLYDNLKHENEQERFQEVLGKGRMYMFIMQGLGSILGAFAYTVDPNLPLWISIAFMGVTVLIVLGFDEYEYVSKDDDISETYYEQIKKQCIICYQTPKD